MQPSPEFIDVLRRITRIAEMSEEEPRRPPRENGRKRVLPDLKTDVRRRGGGQDVRAIINTDARRVSHESDIFRGIKVADMVRSVAGRIRDFEFARAQSQHLATLEDAQIFLGDRQSFSE